MLHAVPADPRPRVWVQPDGSRLTVQLVGDEFIHYYVTADGGQYRETSDGWLLPLSAEQLAQGRAEGEALRQLHRMGGQRRAINHSFPTTGQQRALAILVEFADNEFTIPTPNETYRRMLNEEGFSDYNATGSARDYFLASSNGIFEPTFDVYGPVKLSGNMQYYGQEMGAMGHDQHPDEMVIQACQLADEEVDFTQYDRDNDGIIDNVYIFYAGRGQASGGSSSTIWPHSADIYDSFKKTYRFDGLLLNHYACNNELDETNSLAGIGTFCHEFSHVLGLPDFYATTQTASFTCGSWSLMDYGPYNNGGHTPPTYSAYERFDLGWLQPQVLTDEPATVRLTPMSEANEACMLYADRPTEYYIFENRQKTGWDRYLPGHGMLVWHIDYQPSIWRNNSVNNNPNHLYVDIMEADGTQEERSRDGDCFPGTAGITSMTDETWPNLIPWSGNKMERTLTDIRELDGDIYFEYNGGNPPLPTTTPTATNIAAQSVSISWPMVEGADNYLLTVSQLDDEGHVHAVLEQYNQVSIGNVTNYDISPLHYATNYLIQVQAVSRYYKALPGEGLTVRTADPTFDLLQPETADATNITGQGFTAHWMPLADATGYEVQLFQRAYGETQMIGTDFSDFPTLPTGWATTASASYNTTAYSGHSAPSLKLTNDGETIRSATVPSSIQAIIFWHRSTTANTTNTLQVELLGDNGEWSTLDQLQVERVSGGTTTNYGIDSNTPLDSYNARALRITFHKTGNGDVALDDITINYGAELLDSVLTTANTKATEYDFSELSAGETYFYRVRAINADGLLSQWSNVVPVKVGVASGIVLHHATTGRQAYYYDVTGRRIQNPTRGLYINSTGQKIVVR